jgi:hypothetical protein
MPRNLVHYHLIKTSVFLKGFIFKGIWPKRALGNDLTRWHKDGVLAALKADNCSDFGLKNWEQMREIYDSNRRSKPVPPEYKSEVLCYHWANSAAVAISQVRTSWEL